MFSNDINNLYLNWFLKNIRPHSLSNTVTDEDTDYDLSLSDTFCLFHPDFSTINAHLNNPKNSQKITPSEFKASLNALKDKAIKHYSNQFEKDMSQCIANTINDIYTHIKYPSTQPTKPHFDIKYALLTADESTDYPSIYKQVINIFKAVLYLQEVIDSLAIEHTDFLKSLSMQNLDISNFASLSSYINNKNSSLNPSPLFKDQLNNLNGTICKKQSELQSELHSLYSNTNDDDFKNAIAFCENQLQNNKDSEGFYRYIINFVTTAEYALSTSFNREIILTFLFCDYNIDTPIFNSVIKKNERFFQHTYESLLNISPEASNILDINLACPRELTDSYYSNLPKFELTETNPLLLFKLKKLISLYRFYRSTTKNREASCIDIALNAYYKILSETTLLHPTVLKSNSDNMVSEITSLFGITQSQLAKILNEPTYSISRNKNKESFISDHSWFFSGATSFTYTYLMGDTTIPTYGKGIKDSPSYEMKVMGFIAYAELFLKYMLYVSQYKAKLESSESPIGNKYTLSKNYIQELSECVISLMNAIQTKRIFLDKMNNLKNSPLYSNDKKDIFQNLSAKILSEISEALSTTVKSLNAINTNELDKHIEKINALNAKLTRLKDNRRNYIDLDAVDNKITSLESQLKTLWTELSNATSD